MTGVDRQIADLITLVGTTVTAPSNPTPQDRRDLAAVVAPLFRGPIENEGFAPVAISSRAVQSRDGARIGVRLYTPLERAVPVTILYIHGGGWVAGSIESYEPEVRRLITKTRMSVASVEYRLAPEHPRPAAIEDCLAAARTLIDSGEALAIAGDSAGGNLALECAIALKEDGADLAALLLFYPVVDPAALGNDSYRENGRDYLLTGEDMAYYWREYLGAEGPESFVRESPFGPNNLKGLPSTILVTAGFDPLRDEGRHLAVDLVHADVPVLYLPNPSLTHGFQQMVPRVEAATLAVDRAYVAFRNSVENALLPIPMQKTLSRPPLDPEIEEALIAFTQVIPATLSAEMIPALRVATDVEDLLEGRAVTHREMSIPGYGGDSIILSILARADHLGLGPGIYHAHGGGMVIGDRFTGMAEVLDWVEEFDAVCVTVEYRLAPEFPDPYPVEDCYAGLVWTSEHARELGIDASRLIIVGGSAGGGLAAGTTLLARDRNGPELFGSLLMYPMIDDRNETVSSYQIDGVGFWDRGSNDMGWDALLGARRKTSAVSIYAAPARATDLSDLPPTFIDVASAEVFRDEAVAYASRIWADGGVAELHVVPGGFHGFENVAPHAPLAKQVIAMRRAWLARLLGSPTDVKKERPVATTGGAEI